MDPIFFKNPENNFISKFDEHLSFYIVIHHLDGIYYFTCNKMT